MSEGSDLTKKITETKRQTEVLKNQLQNLIDEGKNLICPSKQDCIPDIDGAYKNPVPCANKAQIIKSYDKHSNNISTNTQKHKAEVKPGSPKKLKAYDVKDARTFMKKQKEKLIVQQKETQEEQRIKAEIKRKKLQDLDKKSRELLSKNVQARKERSNSRDRSNVRLDNFSNVPSNLRKAASVDKIDVTSQKNPNLLYPNAPHYVKNSINKKTNKDNPDKFVIFAGNFTRKDVDKKTIQSNKVHTNISTQNKTNLTTNSTNIETKNYLEVNNKEDINSLKKKDEISTRKSPSSIKHLENINQKGLKPTILFGSGEDELILPNYAKTNIDSVKNILEYKSSNSSKSNSNVTVKSPNLEKNEMVRLFLIYKVINNYDFFLLVCNRTVGHAYYSLLF